jgi:hypothetical protein
MPQGHDVPAPVLEDTLRWAFRANTSPVSGGPGNSAQRAHRANGASGALTVKGFPPFCLEGGEIRAGVGREPVQEFFILARARYPLLSRKYM